MGDRAFNAHAHVALRAGRLSENPLYQSKNGIYIQWSVGLRFGIEVIFAPSSVLKCFAPAEKTENKQICCPQKTALKSLIL